MLSQQFSNDTNLGQHQRKHSTPTNFNNSNILQVRQGQQQEHHRRGLSLDQSIRAQQDNALVQQDGYGNGVEHVLRQRLTQSTMREAQQQHQTDRPGLYETQDDNYSYIAGRQQLQQYLTTHKTEPRQEPGSTPSTTEYFIDHVPDLEDQVQNLINNAYKTQTMDTLQSFDSINSIKSLDGFRNGVDEYTEYIQSNGTTNLALAKYSTQTDNYLKRPNSQQGPQRPCTPQHQIASNQMIMTPAATPFSNNADMTAAFHSRTADSSPVRRDPNLTIKVSHAMQRGTSYQDNFSAIRQNALSPIPSPPHTAPLKPRGSVDLAAFPQPDFFSMESLQTNIPPWTTNTANYSPESNSVSSAMSSFQSSPEMAQMSLFEDLIVASNTQSTGTSSMNASPVKKLKQARSQSVPDLDPLECIEDTGISSEAVDSFIKSEPENRWSCLFPDCGKSFGRKENVKSHVQTHLDDRQYRCKHCSKRFVRQHDLKRHANIHSGVKSYPCPCGKQFARHDALTRHRQRGMCIGAFEGTPKKVIKRGRPKKSRPETGEILEKSAKTRQATLDRRYPGKYTSSVSSSSVGSCPSPEPHSDDMDFIASSPSHAQRSSQQLSSDLTLESFSYTPPTSPSYSTGDCVSSRHSQHSYTPKAVSMSPSPNITAIPEEPQQLPESLSQSRKSSSSYFGTPPELELTSSSPPASKFFDFEASSVVNPSGGLPMLSNTGAEFFNKDFDLSSALSRELAREELSKEGNNGFFNDFVDMTGVEVNDAHEDSFFAEFMASS